MPHLFGLFDCKCNTPYPPIHCTWLIQDLTSKAGTIATVTGYCSVKCSRSLGRNGDRLFWILTCGAVPWGGWSMEKVKKLRQTLVNLEKVSLLRHSEPSFVSLLKEWHHEAYGLDIKFQKMFHNIPNNKAIMRRLLDPASSHRASCYEQRHDLWLACCNRNIRASR